MHKFVRALDNLPPIQEQTSQVSRFWGQSHGKQIHKPMEYTFLNILTFASKNWLSRINYVEIHSSQAYSSLFVIFDHLVDKINAKQGYCYQFVAFRYVSYMMSKWWETMKIHQGKTKFKIEWEGSYPVKRILSDPFSFLCLPYTWF